MGAIFVRRTKHHTAGICADSGTAWLGVRIAGLAWLNDFARPSVVLAIARDAAIRELSGDVSRLTSFIVRAIRLALAARERGAGSADAGGSRVARADAPKCRACRAFLRVVRGAGVLHTWIIYAVVVLISDNFAALATDVSHYPKLWTCCQANPRLTLIDHAVGPTGSRPCAVVIRSAVCAERGADQSTPTSISAFHAVRTGRAGSLRERRAFSATSVIYCLPVRIWLHRGGVELDIYTRLRGLTNVEVFRASIIWNILLQFGTAGAGRNEGSKAKG